MIDELAEMREHMNQGHRDTLTLIAGHVAASTVDDASISHVDAVGIEFEVTGGPGRYRVRRDHAAPCSTIDAVRAEFFAALASARTSVGDSVPLTSVERERAGVASLRTYVTTVTETKEITPSLRQITFGGGLEEFVSIGGDQFVYVLLPPRGASDLTIGTDFTWEAAREMSDDVRPTGAYYTVRSWRPEVGEIDAWFVLHGDTGAASAWATDVAPGAPAALWGPRTAYEPPATTSSYLLVVDETGYAAAAAILDDVLDAAPTTPVTVLAECDTAPLDGLFATGTNVEVRWCSRDGRPPGRSPVLLDAVRRLDVDPGTYAYGGAESKQITAVRRYLREERELASAQVSMTGYWRS